MLELEQNINKSKLVKEKWNKKSRTLVTRLEQSCAAENPKKQQIDSHRSLQRATSLMTSASHTHTHTFLVYLSVVINGVSCFCSGPKTLHFLVVFIILWNRPVPEIRPSGSIIPVLRRTVFFRELVQSICKTWRTGKRNRPGVRKLGFLLNSDPTFALFWFNLEMFLTERVGSWPPGSFGLSSFFQVNIISVLLCLLRPPVSVPLLFLLVPHSRYAFVWKCSLFTLLYGLAAVMTRYPLSKIFWISEGLPD